MEKKASAEQSNQINNRSIFMLFLSVYVLSAMLIDTFFSLPLDISELLQTLDFIICIIFLVDFFLNFYTSDNKLGFLKWGWIDFISSIPEIQVLRWGRVARIIKILRLLRALRSTKSILSFVFKNRAQGTFLSVALISVVLIIFSSIAILTVEVDPLSNIKSPSDALWWAFVTMTTVGYGDLYPITPLGRGVAALLMTAGVGLFGTFTAFVASYFIESNVDNEISNSQQKETIELKKELVEIKELLKKLNHHKDFNGE